MNAAFFPKLAWAGIKKNHKLYVPYILSVIGMVFMQYTMNSLSFSPLLSEMRGGGNMELILSLGKFVIAVFALIFLFYTNSFLIRRRNKEFGLYNILGMGKSGISRVLFWESLFVALIGVAGGMVIGIAFSKLIELGLLNAIKEEIDYRFAVSPKAVFYTLIIFAIIFVLLLIKSVIKVHRTDPIQLLRSENAGEKPPKANWVLALIGFILLAASYVTAVMIKSPMTAIVIFFVAVILVIIATYLLFVSGSVALCRILQKNKRYYYKKQHFVSVSSMAYRMKRNGGGLASICILCTMVLVIISSTSSLYFGADDSIKGRFPNENILDVMVNTVDNLTDEKTSVLREGYEKVFEEYGVDPKNVSEYPFATITGLVDDGVLRPEVDINGYIPVGYENVYQLFFVAQEDYDRIMGTDLSADKGETFIYTYNCEYDDTSIDLNGNTLSIVGELDSFVENSSVKTIVMPTLMFVISDFSELNTLNGIRDDADDPKLIPRYYYGYDLEGDEELITSVFRSVTDSVFEAEFLKSESGYGFTSSCYVQERDDFYVTFGGLFFVGILLSIVFIFAAAMIIYYKQVSEGYEDRARFEIMQNVGMTKKDIKKSINSQVLTVFFAPLLMAGLHLAFAFPLIWKMLMAFNLTNLKLAIVITVIAFVIFGLFYAIIYKLTARAYYSIVSSNE